MTKTRAEDKPTESDRLRARTFLQQGHNAYNHRRYEEALASFLKAVAADPGLLRAQTARAHALLCLGRFEEALASARAVIERAPDYPFAYGALGAGYQALGRNDEARSAFNKALELGPGESRIHYNVACFFASIGDEEGCRRHLEQTLELEPRCNSMVAVDPDFNNYRERPWFQDLVAFK